MSTARTTTARLQSFCRCAPVVVAIVLGGFVGQAHANAVETIIHRCAHELHPQLGGFTPSQYAQALRHLPTVVREYDGECEELIRNAELNAASGSSAASGSAAAVVVPPTPAEQQALTTSARTPAAATRVGGSSELPGVVHADVASALNSLPTPLLALVAALAACAIAVGVGFLPPGLRERLFVRRRK